MNFPRHDCSLNLEHNKHRDYYQTVQEWIDENDFYDWVNESDKEECIKTNEIWTIHWYPITPIGFHSLVAPTLEKLLEYAKREENDV